MRSLKLMTSTDSETEDDEFRRDEICLICKQWCVNEKDFEINFVSCGLCPHSYHKQCIPIIYHSAERQLNCDEIRSAATNKRLHCNRSIHRTPKLLIEILSYEFAKMSYFYHPNGDPIYYCFARETCNLYNAEIFTRTQSRAIKWKGIAYHIGDSIQMNDKNTIKIGMIKKIYIYNEPHRLPTFCIFYYRKHFETQRLIAHNEEYVKDVHDREIFLDIESGEGDNEISIESVAHKVLVCDDFDSFEESKQCNFKEYDAVYFCQYSFTMENYTKYKSTPFEKINIRQIKKKINVLSRELEKKYNAKIKRKEKNRNSIDKVAQYLNTYDEKYVQGEDEYACFDRNIPFALVMKPKTTQKKTIMKPKHAQQQKTAQVMKPKMVQQKVEKVKCNKNNGADDINDSDQCKMRQICQILGITKGVHTGINLYGFAQHIDVYKELLSLTKIHDENTRNAKIFNMNSNHLRDIKSKIQSEGKIGKKREMVSGIVKKLKEFKINYERNTTNKEESVDICDDSELELLANIQQKKRKRKSLFANHNNNNNNRKKRRII